MKLKQSQLQKIIREEFKAVLNEADFDATDEMKKDFDEDLDHMREAMQNVALSVIDQYSADSEKYGEFTKEAARKEITEVLEATLVNFLEDALTMSPGLETILDQEFDEADDPARAGVINEFFGGKWDKSCHYTFDDVKDEYYDSGGQRVGVWVINGQKKHSSQMTEAEIMDNEKRIRGEWC